MRSLNSTSTTTMRHEPPYPAGPTLTPMDCEAGPMKLHRINLVMGFLLGIGYAIMGLAGLPIEVVTKGYVLSACLFALAAYFRIGDE